MPAVLYVLIPTYLPFLFLFSLSLLSCLLLRGEA